MTSTTSALEKAQVYRYKTDVMRKLQHYVSHGYENYVTGIVHPRKIRSLIYKLDDRYNFNLTTQQRYRARIKGLANVQFLAWQKSDSEIYFWVLSTSGESLFFDLESKNIKSASSKKDRIELTGYELLQLPARNRPASWTWRMQKANYETWIFRIQNTVRHRSDDGLRQIVWSLSRSPGFAGIRNQVLGLKKLIQAELRRAGNPSWCKTNVNFFIGWQGKHKKALEIAI